MEEISEERKAELRRLSTRRDRYIQGDPKPSGLKVAWMGKYYKAKEKPPRGKDANPKLYS